jgi:hypothetical protein
MPLEGQCSSQTSLQGVYTEVFPEKSLTTRRTGFSQAYLMEMASPRQTAYHSIVPPYICGDARVPRSRLDAVPRLVAAPGATSDNGQYVTQAGLDRAGCTLIPINERFVCTRAAAWLRPCDAGADAGSRRLHAFVRPGFAMRHLCQHVSSVVPPLALPAQMVMKPPSTIMECPVT